MYMFRCVCMVRVVCCRCNQSVCRFPCCVVSAPPTTSPFLPLVYVRRWSQQNCTCSFGDLFLAMSESCTRCKCSPAAPQINSNAVLVSMYALEVTRSVVVRVDSLVCQVCCRICPACKLTCLCLICIECTVLYEMEIKFEDGYV